MGDRSADQYYACRREELLRDLKREAQRWRPIVCSRFGQRFARAVLCEARLRFEGLIPQMPYIGGDENHLTDSLLDAARCLAFYQAMQARGKTAQEAGKVLYDSIMSCMSAGAPDSAPEQRLTLQQLMERRRRRAARSQLRQYPQDWVYTFVLGDGREFDYGYDFTECAAQKLYRAQGADEFLPFYCFLDSAVSRVLQLGLVRTMTLAQGDAVCNPRFKQGRKSELRWPPPFLR